MQGRTLGTFDDDFDRDAAEQSEARVVNVTDEVARFEIAQGPGSKPRRYRLQPWGGADSGVHLQLGYTIETKGVGRAPIMPTIEQLTEREVYPGGPRLPMVVSVDNGRADRAREKWMAALANRGKAKLPRIVLQDAEGNKHEAELAMAPAPVATAAAPRRAAPLVEDVEDQGGGAVDVDPDLDPDNTPDPTADLPIAGKVPMGGVQTPPRARRGGRKAAG
jgi:hypothetical protein